MNSLEKIVMGVTVVLSITILNAKNVKVLDSSYKHETKLILIDSYFATFDKQGVHQLQPVFESYFLLKDALIKSDGKAASLQSNGLLNAIKGVNMEALNAEERAVWKPLNISLANNAKKIAETQDAKRQRLFFKSVSKNIYDLLKASKPSGSFYYQYCPMADGYWLSKESAIKNPYYGSQMLSCGRVAETIKQ